MVRDYMLCFRLMCLHQILNEAEHVSSHTWRAYAAMCAVLLRLHHGKV